MLALYYVQNEGTRATPREIVIYRKKECLMKKNINKEVLAGLTKLSEENSFFGYLAAKRMYRADCVCHLVKLPFDFKKW